MGICNVKLFRKPDAAEQAAGVTEPIRKPTTELTKEPMAVTSSIEEVKQEDPSIEGEPEVAPEEEVDEEHIKVRSSLTKQPLQVPVGEMKYEKKIHGGEERLEEEKHEEAHAPAAEGGEAEGGEAQAPESPFEKAPEVLEEI